MLDSIQAAIFRHETDGTAGASPRRGHFWDAKVVADSMDLAQNWELLVTQDSIPYPGHGLFIRAALVNTFLNVSPVWHSAVQAKGEPDTNYFGPTLSLWADGGSYTWQLYTRLDTLF
jgi:hypothetical protein